MPRTRREWTIDTILMAFTAIILYLYVAFNVPQSINHVMRIAIDNQIPRLSIFTIPYLVFLPWLYGTLIYSWYKNRSFRQLAYAFIVINLIAFFVYQTFQTYVPRDPITSNDLFSGILQFIYNNDQAYAGFPSLHSALSASIATYFVIRHNKWSRAVIAMAVLIVISTLFTKQHFILDAVSGVALGVLVTCLVFKFMPDKTMS